MLFLINDNIKIHDFYFTMILLYKLRQLRATYCGIAMGFLYWTASKILKMKGERDHCFEISHKYYSTIIIEANSSNHSSTFEIAACFEKSNAKSILALIW